MLKEPEMYNYCQSQTKTSHEEYLWQDSHSDAKTNPLQKYTHNTQNGPVNMLDPIRKHFGYSQLWSLLPLCSQNWAEWYMADPTSRIRVSSVFPEKAWNMLCNPSWPGQGLAKRIWSGSKLVWRNHRARFLVGCNWPTTTFLFSHSVLFFHTRAE